LSLKIFALRLPVTFAAGLQIPTSTLCVLTGSLPVATLMLRRFLRDTVRQFRVCITRALAPGFLRDMTPNLLLLLLVLNSVPAVIDLIGPC